MSRINQVELANANDQQQTLLNAVKEQLGVIPNFIKVFAQSPESLQAFLGLFHIANVGKLSHQTRERIALALAQHNECQYCLSAHTALGKSAGLNGDEIAANRAGTSQDAKAAAAVEFARALAEHSGDVSNTELLTVRKAGYSDAEIVEIITHVGLNTLTNILGKASQVDIDFPKVAVQQAA